MIARPPSVRRAGLLAALALCCGCKDKPAALAELVQISGPPESIERATGAQDWRPAALGTKFYLGDAARTGVGRAQLRLGDTSRLEMDPHTVLRLAGAATPRWSSS